VLTANEAFLLALVLLGLGFTATRRQPRRTGQAERKEPGRDRAPSTTAQLLRQSLTAAPAPSRSSQDFYERTERAAMPGEIARGKLVISERTFRRRGDRPLYAKVDQGFLTEDGRLVLVETKDRLRVTHADVVQLSCQALAIHSEVGNRYGRPADYGYIRLQPQVGQPIYRAFRLYGADVIDQLVERYHAMRQRKDVSRSTTASIAVWPLPVPRRVRQRPTRTAITAPATRRGQRSLALRLFAAWTCN